MCDENEIPEPQADSGPLCAHWSEPGECREVCACGHLCHMTDCAECACEAFVDAAEDMATLPLSLRTVATTPRAN